MEETRTATEDSQGTLLSWSRDLRVNGDPSRTFQRDHVFNPGTGERTITDTTPEGRIRTTELDAKGRVTETKVEGFYPVTYEYDATTGRLVEVKQGPEGGGTDERTFTLGYDSLHRLTRRAAENAYPLSGGLLPPPTRAPRGFPGNGRRARAGSSSPPPRSPE